MDVTFLHHNIFKQKGTEPQKVWKNRLIVAINLHLSWMTSALKSIGSDTKPVEIIDMTTV